MVVVDSLLTSREHGVVIIDFEGFEGGSDWVREHQDDLYTSLQRKLLQDKPLLSGRKLAVEVNVLTYVPDDEAARRYIDVEVVGSVGFGRETEAICGDTGRHPEAGACSYSAGWDIQVFTNRTLLERAHEKSTDSPDGAGTTS